MTDTQTKHIAHFLWKLLPIITTAVFLLPIIFGLLGTWLPAFGYFPSLGLTEFSLKPWQALLGYPGFQTALLNTLVTGLGSACFALLFCFFLLRGLYASAWFKRLERSLSPILSIPHAAFAIGLGFLIAPSGWLSRLIHEFSGLLPTPPLVTTFQDPHGLSLIAVLVLKETPFLLFMSLAVLPSLNVSKTLWLVQSQGHSSGFAWRYLLLPRLYQQIRLPFFAVVAYSLTVVDIALIAGPTTPPTLALMVLQRFNDPELTQRTLGAAGATLLLFTVIVSITGCYLIERLITGWQQRRLNCVLRQKHFNRLPEISAKLAAALMAACYLGAILVTLLWSITGRWRYPDLLPGTFSFRAWERISQRISEPFWCTFLLASYSSLIALVLVILALENEIRLQRLKQKLNLNAIQWLVYLPLLLPQIAFIFGFQIVLIHLNWDGNFVSLLWSHLIFVLPYIFLTLSGPYREFDQRYSWQGISLTGKPWAVFWRVKIAMLLRPILYAFATGFAVSIAQYLPTLFIGAGKYTTITTEAVAMATGSDRRMMAVIAIWQQALPLLTFTSATLLPVLIFRHRKAMS